MRRQGTGAAAVALHCRRRGARRRGRLRPYGPWFSEPRAPGGRGSEGGLAKAERVAGGHGRRGGRHGRRQGAHGRTRNGVK